jgi:hypothetical protein
MSSADVLKYYLPVRLHGARYAEARDVELPLSSRPVGRGMEAYFARQANGVEAEVEVAGELFKTLVYKLHEPEDGAFVIVDEQGLPNDVSNSDISDGGIPRSYFEDLIERWAHSESIAPQQSVYLPSGFIEPRIVPVTSQEPSLTQTQPWHELKEHSRIVILGEAGAGKTSLIRYMATELARETLDSDAIRSVPVYIQARKFPERTDLHSVIQSELLRPSVDAHIGDIRALFGSGAITLCLDGLDEIVMDRRMQVVESIRSFTSQYPRVRIVVGTRTSSYRWFFPDFKHFELAPFTTHQVAEWTCQRLYHHGVRSWEPLLAWLHSDNDLMEMARNPLLLAVLVHRYDVQSLRLPGKSEILRECVDALLTVWDTVRGIVRRSNAWATPFRKLSRLCRLAFYDWSGKSMGMWSAHRFTQQSRFHEDGEDDPFRSAAEDTDIVSKAKGGSGWTFRHRALADFLAARYIVDKTEDLSDLIRTSSHNDHWSQVWSLACGISVNADHLIRSLVAEPTANALNDVSLAIGILGEDASVESETIGMAREVLASALERAAMGIIITSASDDQYASTYVLLEPTESGPTRKAVLEEWSDVLARMYTLKLNQPTNELRSLLNESEHVGVRTLARGFETDAFCKILIEDREEGAQLRVAFHSELPMD